MSYRSGAIFSSSSSVRMPAMPLPTITSFIFALGLTRMSMGFSFMRPPGLHVRLARVQEVEHRLARAVQVSASSASAMRFARARQVHAQHLADGRGRAVGHHHDAVGQQHRLVDVVRDHHHRVVQVRHDAQHLVLQVARVSASSAPKGSSSSSTLGSIASARAMPTRCFMPPEISPAALQRMRHAHHLQVVQDPVAALGLAAVRAKILLDRDLHVLVDGQPGQQRVVLEHHRAVGAGAVDLAAVEEHAAAGWAAAARRRCSAAWTCRSPSGRSARRTRRADLQVDALQHRVGLPSRVKLMSTAEMLR
jgi:hypothetical protein